MRHKLLETAARISSYLDERDATREFAIKKSREVVRLTKKVLKFIREGDYASARESLEATKNVVLELMSRLRSYPDLLYTGLVYNALSEYVEASIVLNIVEKKEPEGPEELEVPPVPYLQGLGDAVGELRRLVLLAVKRKDFEEAWRLIGWMEGILEVLQQLDYPDPLIPGVRRKADVARRLVDETLALLVDLESRQLRGLGER
ncbi:MAG: haloacid dehalogenase [Acidilobaceae archaeon]